MQFSRNHHHTQAGKFLKPELFGAAFMQLDQLIERFHPILEDDRFLQQSLDDICDELKATAVEFEDVPCAKGEQVIEHLDKASMHALDMAKEEQRIIDESDEYAVGNEELDSATYFALANELRLCSTQFRRNLISAT